MTVLTIYNVIDGDWNHRVGCPAYGRQLYVGVVLPESGPAVSKSRNRARGRVWLVRPRTHRTVNLDLRGLVVCCCLSVTRPQDTWRHKGRLDRWMSPLGMRRPFSVDTSLFNNVISKACTVGYMHDR
ncbi:hypothetical protein RRG08_021837 [Elysia crispata]|uniref:Uncharacterized protein n=1 Tax=Elysia crispata TaxID=231223 RepID=A0AAE0ZYQ8_9GAST|nr:hypothetical protein RRG08_021837 [Elysia crispata]